MKFFLGSKKDEDGDSDASDSGSESEEEGKTIKEVRLLAILIPVLISILHVYLMNEIAVGGKNG